MADSVCNNDAMSQKLVCLYPEVISYLHKKLLTVQAITEFDAAELRHIKSSDMTPQLYADDPVAKPCKVAEI